jgi:hypothetical protein
MKFEYEYIKYINNKRSITVLLLLVMGLVTALLLVSRRQLFPSRANMDIADTAVVKKVFLLIYNPIINGQKLTLRQGWNNPDTITNSLLADFGSVSNGYVNYVVAERIEIDGIPAKYDSGFVYTDEQYINCLTNSSLCHMPDGVDYAKIFSDFGICNKNIDEVWLWGGPYFGYQEFIPVNFCGPTQFVMGFNYERGVGEAWHDFGHRMEHVGISRVATGAWVQDETNEWNKFSLISSHCGNVHYPPGTNLDQIEYNYFKTSPVNSDCDGYLNYPTGPFVSAPITCSAWGCSAEGYMKWWLRHIPSKPGTTPVSGKTIYNNWWKYYAYYDQTAQIVAPTPAPRPGEYSQISATLDSTTAVYNFIYSGVDNVFTIDMSTLSDMSWDVYHSFASGPVSPIVEHDPTKWGKYSCGNTLYWRIRSGNGVVSPIQTSVINCIGPTPTPSPTLRPTATPTPISQISPTPLPVSQAPILSFQDSCDQVLLQWTASASNSTYQLERCTGSNCTNFQIISTGSVTNFTDNVRGGRDYRYRVKSTTSGYSQIVSTRPYRCILNSASGRSCNDTCSRNKLLCFSAGASLTNLNNLEYQKGNQATRSCTPSPVTCATVMTRTGTRDSTSNSCDWTYCRCN